MGKYLYWPLNHSDSCDVFNKVCTIELFQNIRLINALPYIMRSILVIQHEYVIYKMFTETCYILNVM